VSDQFPPGLLYELDRHIRRIAEEVADERLGQVSLTGGREWLTARQAGEILDCSPEAIRKRAKRGRLVCRYQGTRLYVSAASVLELRSR
jgi:DNA-directed RNA polymerase specialized sigma24 family protein